MEPHDETTAAQAPMPVPAVRLFAPGTSIGSRYEVRSVLGTGGSASVYAAWDRDLGRLVALKVLRHDRLTEAALKRFRREVAVARDADSPRLVRVYDIGEAGGTVFLTMELVDGESLRDRLEAGPSDLAEALRIGAGVLRALADLHRLGIVHRDVKPENVLLGRDGTVKLADFGLARHWEGGDTRATETDGIVGTMAYLAPEQALGKAVDARTDLYAFGVLLFEMASGRLPFSAGSAFGSVVARLHERAPDLRQAWPGAPSWLAAVVARLLEKEPADRYGSAEEVVADLEARRAPGTGTASRRRRHLATLAGGAALALGAGLLLAWRLLPVRARSAPSLVADGAPGIKAVDASGKVLWRRTDVPDPARAAVVRSAGGRSFRIAALADPSDGTGIDAADRRLLYLDPASGEVTERHLLANGTNFFGDFSDRYRALGVTAVDVDGDGDDEVIATFTHFPYYPSYAVLFEPRSTSSRVVFAHSGHARLAGAFDLDGDGRRELVIEGPNNRMGRMIGVAAVKVSTGPGSRDGRGPEAAASPDTVRGTTDQANLLWYALQPAADHFRGDTARFDAASGLLTLHLGSAKRLLTADGFAPGAAALLAGPARQAARDRAYALLRDAARLAETGFPADALAPAREAVAAARSAGDAPLAEWSRRVSARVSILAGRVDEGEAEASSLLDSSPAAADVAFDLARSLHLAGHAAQSVRWYEWGLSRVRTGNFGRSPYEFLEGEIFALVETERWDAATEVVDRYRAVFPEAQPDYYSSFLLWLRGGRPEPLSAAARFGNDLVRAWALEIRLARGEGLDALERDLAAERGRASESKPLLDSFASELAARRGDLEGALTLASAAWEGIRAARHEQTWARALAPLVATRFVAVARRAGREELAREARAEARRFRAASPAAPPRPSPGSRR